MPRQIKGTVYINSKKEKLQEKSSTEQKLDMITSDTESVIFEIESVFPFQLYPDKLIIDRNKITIVRRELFFKRLFPVPLEDTQTVRVNRGLIFAALEVGVRGDERNPNPVTHLWPEDASKAEKYIMKLSTLKKENVELNRSVLRN